MKTTRLLCGLALCGSIGVPATLAVSQDCRKAAFDLVWKAKVRAMQAWDNDPKHSAYVEQHKLKAADLSWATAALRARMLKALDVACGPESLTDGTRDDQALQLEMIPEEAPALLVPFAPEEQDVIPSTLRAVIEPDALPTYDSPARGVDDGMTAAAGFGGWFAYGERSPVQAASLVPMVATPEPATILLAATGICLLAFLVWVRWSAPIDTSTPEERDALKRAFLLGDHLKRFDGSQWDMAIETYQQALKQWKDFEQAKKGPSSTSKHA